MKKFLFAFLFSLACISHAATPLPSDSVLQINHVFTNQNAKNFK